MMGINSERYGGEKRKKDGMKVKILFDGGGGNMVDN